MQRNINQLISATDSFYIISARNRRDFHASSKLYFHFMKKQVAVDPELAKLRETRKRRKLEKAILNLKQFSKKPKPVEEIQIDIKLRKTLGERKREQQEISEVERQRRVILLKEYGRSRSRMASKEINLFRQSIERQEQTLQLLKHLSPELYEAAIQPDDSLLPFVIEGPALTPPLENNYKSPDGDFTDVTKQWVQPILPLLNKKFGIGKLIKAPSFQKDQELRQQFQTSKAASAKTERQQSKFESKEMVKKQEEKSTTEPNKKQELKTATA